MDISQIADLIVATAREQPTILGTHIGSALSRAFPDLRREPGYPGLKRFIQQYCGDRVVRVGDHGGDDVYQYIPEGDSPPPGATLAEIPSAWDVFQRPRVGGKLFVNKSTGELQVSKGDEAPTEDFVNVPSITPEEHRAIAQEYLHNIDDVSKPLFQQALKEEDYWPHWSRLVNKAPYKQDWSTFRFDKLRDLFRARLRGSGLTEELVTASLAHLMQGKKERPLRDKRDDGHGRTISKPLALSRGDLRTLIHEIVNSMGDNELRRVWLPVGDVLDALRVPRS